MCELIKKLEDINQLNKNLNRKITELSKIEGIRILDYNPTYKSIHLASFKEMEKARKIFDIKELYIMEDLEDLEPFTVKTTLKYQQYEFVTLLTDSEFEQIGA